MPLIDDLFPLMVTQYRSIGMIMPDVVVEETHRDQTAITDHPVERGASITDHAFQMPARVQVRCGASDSSGGSVGHAREIYEAFLELQRAREPFEVSTGKRLYRNMLVETIETTTDQATESAMMATIGLREILIVSTQTTGGAGQGAQANPASTAPEVDVGSKSPATTGSVVPTAGQVPSLGAGFGGTAFGLSGPAAIAGQDGITLPDTTSGAFSSSQSGF